MSHNDLILQDNDDWIKKELNDEPILPGFYMYVDGSCIGNPGPGAWACRMYYDDDQPPLEFTGGYSRTTNIRMELMAVIQALNSVADPSIIHIYTDSEYVCKGINEWLPTWLRNDWRSSSGKPVKNQDLWRMLLPLLNHHRVRMHWIRGHAGYPDNERCDFLARRCAMQGGHPIDPGYEG